jgi:hypothetical protein
MGPRVDVDGVEKRKILYCQESNLGHPFHLLSGQQQNKISKTINPK